MVEGGFESISESASGVTVSAEHAVDSLTGAATSAATSVELAWLVEVWGSLPDDVRADVVSTVNAATLTE